MIKKWMAVFMTVVLLITAVVPMTAYAEATVTFSLGSVTHTGVIEAGETITIPVSVRSTSPFCAVQVTLQYDHTKWEAVEGTKADFLKNNFQFNELNIAPVDTETGEPILGKALVGGMSLEDTTAPTDTLLATITLRALRTIDRNDVIALEGMTAAKAPSESLECTGVNADIVIERDLLEKGDVNLDGVISLPDATLLFYAVNGMVALTEEQQVMADLDEDESVSLMDATQLFYRVNGLTE